MALINDVKKEINAKIVYIGPKDAGKRTALRYIYSKLKPECRSELKSMAIGDHQLLFFDFSYPASQRTDGYSLRFHLYTILAGEDTLPPWKESTALSLWQIPLTAGCTEIWKAVQFSWIRSPITE